MSRNNVTHQLLFFIFSLTIEQMFSIIYPTIPGGGENMEHIDRQYLVIDQNNAESKVMPNNLIIPYFQA